MAFINDVLDIKEFENNAVRTLSLGQRMRADLGAALIHNPKVLYLDEPTIGLDIVVKDKIRDAIKEMNHNFNTTVILTTHDLADIEELCNRIIIIDKGKKIYDGNIENLKIEYGAMTTLELDIKDLNTVSNLNLNQKFGLDEQMLTLKTEQNKLIVDFNKNVINVSQIAGYIMSLTNVIDMTIKQTDITTIVKQIYTDGVK
jgi:ABC-2 type transport system ATP-binding protein